jgi:hypothetical protein
MYRIKLSLKLSLKNHLIHRENYEVLKIMLAIHQIHGRKANLIRLFMIAVSHRETISLVSRYLKELIAHYKINQLQNHHVNG